MGACCGTPEGNQSQKMTKQLQTRERDDRRIKKLLLLGAGGSGKSTFFKQLRMIHGEGIDKKEKQEMFKEIVYENIISQMRMILEKCTELEKEDEGKVSQFALNEKNEEYRDYIQVFEEDYFESKRVEVADAIKALWSDPAIQNLWKVRARFQIQDSSEYFFKHIDRITTGGYTPTDEDVLLARIRTTGIVEQEFVIEGNRFQVYDVGGQKNERKKWIHCFENVTGVIFIAALSAYDQVLYEDEQTNRMVEAVGLFKQVCTWRWFQDTAMILFLNKKDLFQKKITTNSINVCFPEYDGAPHDEIESREYIRDKFKKCRQPVRQGAKGRKDRKLYVHYTCAIDRNNIKKIFRDVRNVIIRENLRKAALI